MRALKYALLTTLVVGCAVARGENVVYPPGSGVIDVRERGAKGNGTTDDTAALQAAINSLGEGKVLYFPNGTYLISKSLEFPHGKVVDAEGYRIEGAVRRCTFQGQSRDGVVIKLKDDAAGFGDVGKPRRMIVTMVGNMAFDYTFRNLTLDIGSGNAGACGLLYISSNSGAIEDVLVRSSDPDRRGATGIDMTEDYPGPALINRVEVIGFDCAIRLTKNQYGMAFENVTLRDQRVVGLDNAANVIAVRKLKSVNAVPALRNGPTSSTVLVDGELDGKSGAAKLAAIDFEKGGTLVLRNVRAAGYAKLLSNTNGGKVAVDELALPTGVGPKRASQKSLNLPVEETPAIDWTSPVDFKDWAVVSDFGAMPNDDVDDTEPLQRAFDEAASTGKHTVLLPNGVYRVSGTITVRGSVRQVIGLRAALNIREPLQAKLGPVFRVEDGSPTVVFDGVSVEPEKWGTPVVGLEQASANTVAWLHGGPSDYRNSVTGGTAHFADATAFFPEIRGPQRVFVRAWNPETSAGVRDRAVNNGGTLWVLLTKTEGAGWVVKNRNGAKSEFIGGYCNYLGNWGGNPDDYGDFHNAGGSVSALGWFSVAKRLAQETRGDAVRDIQRADYKTEAVPAFRSDVGAK
jgi:hypothetical protein